MSVREGSTPRPSSPSPAPVPFVKMNGLGNDFIIVDGRSGTHPHSFPAADIRRWADRETGVGCDQLIVLEPSEVADVRMRIFNAEGFEVESCGNASRCVADLLFREARVAAGTIDTKGGLLACSRTPEGLITIDMGVPRFGWREIPLAEAREDTRCVPLILGPTPALPVATEVRVSVVNVGNPHATAWVDGPSGAGPDLSVIGLLVEMHALFPQRTNVSLARVLAPGHIEVQIWERGVGLTQACGTAACAAAVSGARTGRTSRDVTVTLPGGDLQIVWGPTDRVLMTGPAKLDFEGELTFP